MNVTHLVGAAAVIAGAVSVAYSGDLNPPPAPIEGTMVSLDKIEPRICIDDLPGDAAAVHVISEPGSYFLANTINVPAGKSGIRVELNPALPAGDYDVSIHLCELAISGFPGSVSGVHTVAHPAGQRVRLRIRPRDGAGNSLITGMGADGIRADSVLECSVADVSIRSCGGSCLDASGIPGAGSVFEASRRRKGWEYSIVLYEDATASLMHVRNFDTASIEGIRLRNGGADGIVLDSIDECRVSNIDLTNVAGSGVSAPNFRSLAFSGVTMADVAGHALNATGTASTALRKRAQIRPRYPYRPGFDTQRCGTSGVSSVFIQNADEVLLDSISVADGGGDGIELVNCAEVVSLAISVNGKGFNRVTGCAGHGLSSSDCENIDLSGLTVSECGGSGVYSTSTLTPRRFALKQFEVDRSGTSSATAGVHIEGYEDIDLADIDISDHTGTGLFARTRLGLGSVGTDRIKSRRCSGDGMDIECEDATLSNVTLERNAGVGGKARVSGSLIIKDSSAKLNFGSGLECTGVSGTETVSVTDSGLLRNGFGVAPSASAGLDLANIASFSVTDSECRSNNGSGIRAADFNRDGLLDRVASSGNGLHGVHCSSPGGLPTGRVRVHDSMCDANGGSGIMLEATTGGEVSECTLTTNAGQGVWIIGSGHVVHRNTCRGNGVGPMIVPIPGNVVGPLIDELTVAGNDNPAANYVD